MKKRNSILVILILIVSTLSLSAQSLGSLKGRILDNKGLPLVSANVYIEETSGTIYNITDEKGYYTLKMIQPGVYNVKISCIGFKEAMIPNVYIKPDKITFLEDIYLPEKVYTTDAIEVIATKTKLIDPEEPGKMTRLGAQLENIPGARDLTKMLTTFDPAIQESSTGNGIIIRGSRPGSSAYFIDGVKVDELGYISSRSIASMTVYSGGIPAKYGDITGGVVIVETKSYFDFLNEHKAKERQRKEEELEKKKKENNLIILE